MQKAFAGFGSRTTAPNNDASSANGSNRHHKLVVPAAVLAFLLAVAISMLVVRRVESVHNHVSVEQTLSNTTNKEEDNQNPAASAATNEQSTSIKTEAITDNGQANVKVQVNGQDVPVNSGESVHKTVTNNGTTTTIDVQTTSVQSGDSAQSFGSSNSSSFSSSFQSSTAFGSQH